MPTKETESSWSDIFTALPQTLGTMAVAAVKFVTPKQPTVDRISQSSGPPSHVSHSEVFYDINQ